MPKPKFTQEQIAYALKQAEGGTAVAEVCRKIGVTEQTLPCPLPLEDQRLRRGDRVLIVIGSAGISVGLASLTF